MIQANASGGGATVTVTIPRSPFPPLVFTYTLTAEQGTSVEVIDLRTLAPWDQDAVYESVKRTNRVVVVYEDAISWGYGAEIAAAIADECFAWLDAPVKRVASTDTFVGYAPQLEDAILPQVADFVRAYEDVMKY